MNDAIKAIKEKYFTNQYVRFIKGPEDYYQGGSYKQDSSISNGKSEDLNFKLTTSAIDPETNVRRQYFVPVSLFSFIHEMGHFVAVPIEDCMKPAFGLDFVSENSSEEWIETIAIPNEINAFVWEAILATIYDPNYHLSTRYITFNSVFKQNKYFKNKYKHPSNHELHPDILQKFQNIAQGKTLEDFEKLWFGRNEFYKNNPINE